MLSTFAHYFGSSRPLLSKAGFPSLRSFAQYGKGPFKHICRNESFGTINDGDLEFFRSVVGNNIITDSHEIEPFNVDYIGKYKGHCEVVLQPKTVQEVSDLLRYCDERKLAVVPQGGNTGLVGGSTGVFDEIILSTSKMNQILDFDEVSGIATVQSGVILENLESFLQPHGYTVPLDLGAKGSCQIGGNLAANAGGLRYLRYGSLHGTVLGVEAVLADGSLFDDLSLMRKNNTGYDLKHLLIGSEGTLGVITAATLLTPPLSASSQVAVMAVASFEEVQTLFRSARAHLGEILSAFEFYDHESLVHVLRAFPALAAPTATQTPFYVLVETRGSNADHDMEKLEGFISGAMEHEMLAKDGVLAMSHKQMTELWQLRENIAEAAVKHGLTLKYDVSIPLSQLYSLVEAARSRLAGSLPPEDIVGYGHVGDGNLHLNVILPTHEYDESIVGMLEPWLFEWIAAKGGSISAEHGMGVMKAPYLKYSKSPCLISHMQKIKKMFDPNGILNPYKVLPGL